MFCIWVLLLDIALSLRFCHLEFAGGTGSDIVLLFLQCYNGEHIPLKRGDTNGPKTPLQNAHYPGMSAYAASGIPCWLSAMGETG